MSVENVDAQTEWEELLTLRQPTPLDYLREQVQGVPKEGGGWRCVLISTGSLCPVHRGHLTMFDIAAQFLATHHNIDVLAGYLSPSADVWVSEKLGCWAIPCPYRYQMCRLACDEHNRNKGTLHVITDPWEGLQFPRFIANFKVRDRLDNLLQREFPHEHLLVLYLCGMDFYRNRRPERPYIIGVGRTGYSSTKSTRPEIHSYACSCDNAPELAHLQSDFSSTELRRRWQDGVSLSDIMYPSAEAYLRQFGGKLFWKGVE